VSARQERLAAAGFADVAEQRAAVSPEERLPYLLLLVDRWEGFTTAYGELDNGRHNDTMLRLLREGPSTGLRIVVAGDRSVLLGKLAGAIEDRLCLRLADRSDYSLAGLSPRKLPDELRAGQAFRTADARECQIALLGAPDPGEVDASGSGQAAALSLIAERWSKRPAPAHRPFRVDVLPPRLSLDEARSLDGWGAGPLTPIVGVGGDELAPIAVDLETYGPGFTVAGPRRSGRSTALLGIATSVTQAGGTVVVLAPRRSPLRSLDGQPGVAAVVTESNPSPQDFVEVLNAVEGHLMIVVDDAELLHPSDIQELLQQVLRDGRDQGHAMVVGGTTEELLRAMRGFTFDARSSRAGLLLTPESHLQGELLGVRLPRSAVFTGPPGRGILALPGRTTLVQVPLVQPAEVSQPA
jgi:S-DNA-T family DNA segregation ATPase FtsK/SpoIIIE